MNDFVLRLMKCARAYESFVGSKLLSKQSINKDELTRIRKEAISKFPELKTEYRDQREETVEFELFNKVLHNTMLKVGFRIPDSQVASSSSIYIRR
ncbi:hypothetical protein [Vibrio sp. B1FLJ16]|uniref:hypothetical protein n=1 Tax=Vibrio sp. B1FLJ16 TaxID=2751178 RepID=UPI0015F531A6|nr:hypothetical protein [Vibrio sp. B1FLJ16]